ncbi:MAG TPA: glycosyltransferase [Thauera sp.]|nr:glycosyltransferase [Thauera sp.]
MSPTVTPSDSVACTVCIANYNGTGLIDACIESVQAQICDFSFEIIVHDDASTDDSVEHIAARHPDVQLMASRENVGFCIANNRLAAAARGEFLLLLNNDATLLPGALDALMHEAARLQQPAILTLPQYDDGTGELLDVGSLLDPFLNPVPNRDAARNDVAMVAGACLWLPKRLWDELGGFPDWFGSIGEDLYLCCRARLSGYPVRALGTSGYRHRVGQSFGGGKVCAGRLVSTFRRRALSERNKTFVIAMACPSPAVIVLLPLHLLLLLLEGALLAALNGRWAYLSDIYLPVIPALLQHRREIRRRRRDIMAARRIGAMRFFSAFTFLPRKLRMLYRHGLPRVNR